MSPVEITIACVIGFLLLMALGLPIGFSFAVVGFIGLIVLRSLNPALQALGSAPYLWTTMEALLPLPLFVLMGLFAFHSKIGADLFTAANKWLGKFPGGLAYATNLACTGFAACTGDSVAAAATMGTIAYPEMQKYKYDGGLAAGCIAAGGTLGILIPPSGPFIMYGFLTQTSVGALFMAGIIPGILLSAIFMITIFILCRRNPKLGPKGDSFSWRERLTSLRGVGGMLALFILIIGGLYFGIFTPSEAGAIGAFGAFLIGIVSRRFTKAALVNSLTESARITSFIFTLVIGAMIFNTLLSVGGLSTLLHNWIATLAVSRWVILVFVLILYIILGMFMDMLAISLLTVPIVVPILVSLGFDPVWFGVIHCVLVEIALVTPPVALNLFVVQGVTKVPFPDVIRGITPFIIGMVACLAILVVFPQIILFLPNSMMK